MTTLGKFCSLNEDQMLCDDSLCESFDKENVNPNSSANLKTKAAPFDFGGCDIIYCKARGMPLDHIGNNATLQFQKGYECIHGAELQCSHPSCKKDGVKFRFCQHCEKAVAKRNFRKRHAHPELLSLEEIEKIALPPLHPALLPSLSPQQNQQDTPMVQNKTTSIKVEATHHIELCHPIFDYNGINLGTEKARQHQLPMDLMEVPSSAPVALAASTAPAVTTSTIHMELPSQHFDTEIIPQAWNDLFLNRPQGRSLIQQKEWLQQVLNVAQIMRQDSCSPKRSDIHVEDHGSISNSIEIVREEFSRNFPPQFINCEENDEGDEQSKYRQHGHQIALTVCTDLELLGTNSLLLDSNGSIIIAYTPRSYREDSMCSPLHYNI